MRSLQSRSPRSRKAWLLGTLAGFLVTAVAACSSDGGNAPDPVTTEPTPTEELDRACLVEIPAEEPEPGEPTEPKLRQELLDMKETDQADRTSGEEWDVNNDIERTERLREIVDEHGWPGRTLVSEDGASAAWLIAQHSDLDVEFQRQALDLMCTAVATDDADPTELAYLEDRVALNSGGQQVYGTQIGCQDGKAVPAPIADEDRVHERRDAVGLQPLDDYLAELEEECAAELGD